ncbi:PP2C family protein-serine/threonine phosphatase [Candidatus Frankia nodulisporulans]|uniref:PP2C family protein-serine/threonine phosphatase n=2 Tax=Candidatus Frankia nodulisporulans TaxID=2060052 RepID=UPI001FD1F96E|nr:PP2C family protein-serine/threonine phosphatase [Candidatus Frankia nodulisporulans]
MTLPPSPTPPTPSSSSVPSTVGDPAGSHPVPVTDETPTVDIVTSMVGGNGDHSELDLDLAAAVSNVGLVHHTNEDGFALRTVHPNPSRQDTGAPPGPIANHTIPAGHAGGGTVAQGGGLGGAGGAGGLGGAETGGLESIILAAVCDGVSTAPGSGPAAVRAARDAVDLLTHIATTMSSPTGTADEVVSHEAITVGAGTGILLDTSPLTDPGLTDPTGVGPGGDGHAGDGGGSGATPGDASDAGGPAEAGEASAFGDDPWDEGAPAHDRDPLERDLAAGDTRPLGPRRHPAAGPGTAWQPSALRAAASAAERGALATALGSDNTPACTFVAAIVTAEQITIGWLGDSRAYLLDQAGPHLLTADDTVAAEAVRAGLRPAGTAETGPGAHTITRWLGTSSPGTAPHVVTCTPTGPGRLILCSDGLWNYLSAPKRLAARVQELPPEASALTVARHLTSAALLAGGGDNITVIVIDLP